MGTEAALALAIILAVGIGVSLGLLGGGGSILTVPVLVYVIGLETKQAISTSLIAVGLTSAVALVPHARAGRLNLRVGLAFGASSMTGAFVGGRLSHFVPSTWLLFLFTLVMLVTGGAMLRKRDAASAHLAKLPWARIVLVGVAVGLFTGLVGAGGGFMIVPALTTLCGLSMMDAAATSLLVIALNSLSAFAGTIAQTHVDFATTALFTVAAIVGAVAGASAAGRLPDAALRRGFALLIVTTAVLMLWRQTGAA
jgi:uncharacterized membrane protein YfcA